MRDVDRSFVPVPERLQKLTADNLRHLNDYKKISNSIYAHDDVKRSLQLLYHDKCYICECDLGTGSYNVEHYLPKQHFPSLGYTWENLHKSCEGCNLAKESDDFFFKDANGKIYDIKLLDPSSNQYRASDYITFDSNSKAILNTIGKDAHIINKAQNTILFLNGHYKSEYSKKLLYSRSNRNHHFSIFVINNLAKYRERLSQIKLMIDTYKKPQLETDQQKDKELFRAISKAVQVYLDDSACYSTCVRVQLPLILNVSYNELIKIKDKLYSELER
ncbi:MAG: hypothetical protein ACRC23_17930 [Aeromonas jandaei]